MNSLFDDNFGFVFGKISFVLFNEVLGATKSAVPNIICPFIFLHNFDLSCDVAVMLLVTTDPIPIVNIIFVLIGEHHFAFRVFTVSEILNNVIFIQI